jgi:hypothetical protein
VLPRESVELWAGVVALPRGSARSVGHLDVLRLLRGQKGYRKVICGGTHPGVPTLKRYANRHTSWTILLVNHEVAGTMTLCHRVMTLRTRKWRRIGGAFRLAGLSREKVRSVMWSYDHEARGFL